MRASIACLSLGFLGMICGVLSAADNLTRFDLGGPWQVHREGEDQNIPATVPGYIHTDLLAAKKIPDPYYRDNESRVQWVGESNWIYSRSFDVPADVLAKEHVLLRCEGLDTLATITLNGTEIARTDNMFRTYEFDVKKLIKPTGNAISIRFESPLPLMRAKEKQRPLPTWAFPGAGYVRKEPCNFGWDWGPTLISCGIWRNISLVAFDQSRLEDVAISQEHAKGSVRLDIDVAASPAIDGSAKATVFFDSKEVATATAALKNGRGKITATVDNPKLWWPAGMGAQPLYTVKVEILDNSGKPLDSVAKRIGLRTLRTKQQTADAPLQFVVNGVPFFAKGANWIPADCFATRLTQKVLRRYVADAAAANMNTLRFWGGGYYEDDAFFDACDEFGVCVWLDFKFGCSTYPAFDPAFLENVKQEARDNIKRLRHHPSIAVWCGNNEIMFFRDKKWSKDKMGEDDYYKLFRDTLGGEIATMSPTSDYVTGSPDCGDVHFWEVWHGGKPFEVYRNIHGFMSEFGFQSWPEPKTIAAFTASEDRTTVESPIIKYHERSNRMYMQVKEDGSLGTKKIFTLMDKYFQKPKDFESTVWLGQILQGYGIKCGAEGWRREMPRSMGCVFWQYNDCWPCTSWASVDYFGRWKALQYMAQKFYAPILVSGMEDAKKGTVDVFVTSDDMTDRQGKLSWTVTDAAGNVRKQGSLDLAIPSRKSQKVQTLEQLPKDSLVWLKLDVDSKTVSDNLTTFVYPKELKLVDPKLSTAVTEKDGVFVVTITAEHPALWTWLELADADARFSQNFVHVTKDSPAVFEVRPAKPMTKDTFEKSLRVRSLYDTYAH